MHLLSARKGRLPGLDEQPLHSSGALMIKSPLLKLWKHLLFKYVNCSLNIDASCPVQLHYTSESPEIHSLVCKSHVKLYLFAIKSLLRYTTNVKVIVHDDGSLTDANTRMIERHIEGVRIVHQQDADQQVDAYLRKYPHSLRYRKQLRNAKQLFDYALLAEGDKLIGLNSDVLFLKPPVEIYEWMQTNNSVLYAYERDPRGPNQIARLLGDVAFVPNVNIGLLCYPRSALQLDIVEDCLAQVSQFDWWTGQMIFAILLANTTYPVRALSPDAYGCGGAIADPNMVFKHYFMSHGMRREYIQDLQAVARQLAALADC